MKYINKTFLLLIVTTLLSGVFFGLFPAKTQAALSMEGDYELYRSYTILTSCLNRRIDPNPRKSKTQDTINEVFSTSEAITAGRLYAGIAGLNGPRVDCNTRDDISVPLKALGYSDIYDMLDDVGGTITPASIQARLKKKVTDEGGRINLLDKPDFRYWFWNSIYRDAISAGGCEGVLNNSFSGNRETNSQGTFYKVETDGKVNKFSVASYNVGTGREVEGIDGSMTAGKKWTCFEIAKQLTKTNADAYASRLKANLDDGDSENDYTVGTAEESGASLNDTNSCESIGGVMSWIMCPVVEILGGALNWVDTQVSRLLEVDTNKVDNPGMYKVWTNFRNIGLTLLILVMLVMVISTALDLGFLDSYTVKKAMPRLVAAIIFMLLSWYICLFLITIANVVGQGTLGIMTAPFEGKASSLSSLFTPSPDSAILQFGGIAVAASVFFLPTIGAAVLGILGSFFGTALLIVALALLILIARQMFIIALIILAPIAIISWIFPGNDKMWKLWWQTFSKLLIMYPLIMALIASGRIFAGVISVAGESSGSGEGLITPILKLAAYVIPYAFIPFTFKFAGGVFGNLAGAVNDRSKGALDRLRKGRQQQYHKIGNAATTKRADVASKLNSRASSTSGRFARSRGALLRGAGRAAGVGNTQAKLAAINKEQAQLIAEQTGNGPDDNIRGSTVSLAAIEARGGFDAVSEDTLGVGNPNALTRVRNGERQYKTLGGGWVNEASVREGKSRFRTQSQIQAALSYEMSKAITEEQVAGISDRYADLANESGMNSDQARGAWIGASFQNQDRHLIYKHTRWEEDGNGNLVNNGVNGSALAEEMYQKRDSYNLSHMSSETIDTLSREFEQARATRVNPASTAEQIATAEQTMMQITDISENFMNRGALGSTGSGADPETPEGAPPSPATPGTTPQSYFSANSAGSASTSAAIVRLAQTTGVYNGETNMPKTPSGPGPVNPQDMS
jgi:hypothetical protein